MSPDALPKGICVRIIWDYSWGIWCNAMIMTFLYFGCAVIKWAKKRTHKQANPIDNLRRCLIFPYLFDHTHQKIPQPHGIQSKTFQPTNCIVFCLLCYAEMCCLVCVWAAFDALLHALQFKFIFRNFSSFVAYHICNGVWPKKEKKQKKRTRQQFIIHWMSEMIYLFACWFHMHTHIFAQWIECAIFFHVAAQKTHLWN